MRITYFGTYALPLANKVDELSTGFAGGSLLTLPGRQTYDAYGTDRGGEGVRTLNVEYDIVETTTADMQTERDAIRALLGKRDVLSMQLYDNSIRWAYARLTAVDMERQVRDIYRQPVRATFELVSAGWNGEYHDTQTALNTSPLSVTHANGGNRTVTNASLTVTAVNTQIAGLAFACGDCDWAFTGTIAAGTSLIVDGATKSITNNGVDAYAQFTLNGGHVTPNWIELAPGNNTATYTAGSAAWAHTLVLAYYDGWT